MPPHHTEPEVATSLNAEKAFEQYRSLICFSPGQIYLQDQIALHISSGNCVQMFQTLIVPRCFPSFMENTRTALSLPYFFAIKPQSIDSDSLVNV